MKSRKIKAAFCFAPKLCIHLSSNPKLTMWFVIHGRFLNAGIDVEAAEPERPAGGQPLCGG
jgi:hypothetical protein